MEIFSYTNLLTAKGKCVIVLGVLLMISGFLYLHVIEYESVHGAFQKLTEAGQRLVMVQLATQRPPQFANFIKELKGCPKLTFSPLSAVWGRIPGQDPSEDPLQDVFRHGIFFDAKFNALNVTKNDPKLVPNIHHYAWYSDRKSHDKTNLRFHHYLSILSALKFNKPDCIYFWYERAPTGKLWDMIKKSVPSLILVYREGPNSIRGNPIRVPEHSSDIVRLEAMLRYGGVYTDLDVLILKPFSDLRKYDVTMGYESAGKKRDWLCNGIILGKPNATFLRKLHESYSTFNDAEWGTHSVRMPATLAQKYPELIHTEIDTFNRPNWEETQWLYGPGKIWKWRKNYAVHLWYRLHNIEHNPSDIKTINTTMGQLFRYIYYGNATIIR